MTVTDRARFRALIPEIKSRWLGQLRGEPLLSPLGRRETIDCLMDTTLLLVQSGLDYFPDLTWLERFPPLVGAVHRHCACALAPLQRYYATGESAMNAVVEPALPGALPEIRALLHAVAAREVTVLCTECTHPDWSGCGLRQLPPGPTP